MAEADRGRVLLLGRAAEDPFFEGSLGEIFELERAALENGAREQARRELYDAVLVMDQPGSPAGLALVRELAGQDGAPALILVADGAPDGASDMSPPNIQSTAGAGCLYLERAELTPRLLARLVTHAVACKRALHAALEQAHQREARTRRECQLALDRVSDPFLAVDQDWRVSEVNQMMLLLMGKPREAVLGQSLWTLVPELEETPNGTAYRKAMEERTTVRLEVRGVRTGRNYEAVFYPTPNGAAGLWRDITERIRSEDSLRAALAEAEEGHRLLDAILRHVPDGITIAGGPPDFPILFASDYGVEHAGRERADLLGQPVGQHQAAWGFRLPDGETLPTAEQMPLYRAAHLGEEVRNQELSLQTQDGRTIPILINAAPIRDEQGQIVGAISAWRDITNRKMMEEALTSYTERLARSNRELEKFAFIASHDLQEPLRKIEMFGERLMQRSRDQLGEQEQDYLDRMVNAAHRMRQMINGLLALSRVTTRGENHAPVDLSALLATVLDDLEVRIRKTGAQVRVEDLPEIEGDKLQIYQLFQNLLGNALKFHRADAAPEIKVRCKQVDSKWVEIQVRDNGIGFDPAHAEIIFQPFNRLHGRSEYDGAGMGLAICRKIVERHGGEIRAEGQPGEGAAFTIRLPLKQN